MSKNTSNRIRPRHPRIGITMRFGEKGDFYLRREYGEALEALGGIPLHLPLIPKQEFVDKTLAELDGILLPGSNSDVDPLRYGEEPHRRLGAVQPLRDEMDLILLSAAEKLELPILGICFGMQALNVARGGKLVQDIESEIPHSLCHQQTGALGRRSHHIKIEAGSLMLNLSGARMVSVNSHHHQSILTAGENLRVTARSLDNVIEAIEDVRQNRFAVGVQWHPELDWENDKFSQGIFNAFLMAAARYRESTNG